MFDTNEIKKNILEIGKRLYNNGFSSGISGNISIRHNDKIFITATGTCLGEITEAEIIILCKDGLIVEENAKKSSSESMMHVEIYKARAEINAIIHAHPPYSTALAVSEETKFPAILAESVVTFGKNIPVVKYETPSTIELAKSVDRKSVV